jgi:hypothetical protein
MYFEGAKIAKTETTTGLVGSFSLSLFHTNHG